MELDPAVQAEAIKQSRVRRNEEWQKIRNPDLVTEKDKEEDFETKTLYERLQENRELKRLEIEEQFRYKNMVYSGLDNEEHKFLEAWKDSKKNEEKLRKKEESEELQKFKARVVDLEHKPNLPDQIIISPAVKTAGAVSRQKQLLSGLVKRRKIDKTPEKPPVEKREQAPVGLLGLGAYSDTDSDKSDAKSEKSYGSERKRNVSYSPRRSSSCSSRDSSCSERSKGDWNSPVSNKTRTNSSSSSESSSRSLSRSPKRSISPPKTNKKRQSSTSSNNSNMDSNSSSDGSSSDSSNS